MIDLLLLVILAALVDHWLHPAAERPVNEVKVVRR